MYCKTCKTEKLEDEMKTKSCCKECHKEKKRLYMKEYFNKPENKEQKRKTNKKYYSKPENKKQKRISDKEYHDKNKDKVNEARREKYKTDPEVKEKKRESDKKYYETISNDPIKKAERNKKKSESKKKRLSDPIKREEHNKKKADWNKNHRDSINNYRNNKKKTDDSFRIACNLRARIRKILNTYENGNKFRTEITQELAENIIARIGNRPHKSYHLDHIIPLAYFDLTNPIHLKLANSPENLQWLSSKENLSKNKTINWEQIRCSLVLTIIAKTIGIK